ncbi:MAG: hypothetical protein N2110_09280 [Flavobacteriales bacterium]|nr:hypothetical protein [Flavobacteriales bacterium]
MKTIKKPLFSFGIFSLAAFSLITGCQKKEKLPQSERDLLISAAFMEAAVQDLKSMADEAAAGNFVTFKSGQAFFSGNCATITWDTTSTPKVITIDFGPVNCLCADGRYRRGKVIITYTGPYAADGTTITIQTQDYFVNDNQVIVTKTIQNLGPNPDGQPVFTVVAEGQIIRTTGQTLSWNSERQRTWIAGYGTPEFTDDEYQISGFVQGSTGQGLQFNIVTLSPLWRQLTCRWFKAGILKIERTGRPDLEIDYGNGTCDGIIQVTRNGQTYTINLE